MAADGQRLSMQVMSPTPFIRTTRIPTPAVACAVATTGPGTPTPKASNTTQFEHCGVNAAGDSLVACLALSGATANDDPYSNDVLCFDSDPAGSNIWFRERDTRKKNGVRLVCFSALQVPRPDSGELTVTCIHHKYKHRAGMVLRFANGTASGREPTDRWQLGWSGDTPSRNVSLANVVPLRRYPNDIAIFAIASNADSTEHFTDTTGLSWKSFPPSQGNDGAGVITTKFGYVSKGRLKLSANF
jgi:hypothetical protein